MKGFVLAGGSVGIRWPLQGEPLLSANDRAGRRLADAEVFA